MEPPSVIIPPCDPWPRPYILENGLRRVAPYHFTYNTYCKQRWRGRELLDIFASEFRDRSIEYYKDAIESGAVVVNGKRVETTSHIVQNGDVISHTLHRHEPPVTALPISILHEDDDIIVINKPSGLPVHPAGRYNYNSVVEIMRAERGHQWNPLPCNRLDRLTSGVMFIGKHAKAAEKLSVQISERTVRKEYIARVKGEFPLGDIICDQPILQISPKLGLNRVRANGKSARTVFKRLAFYSPGSNNPDNKDTPSDDNQGYSIVRCLPVTGRTHQIRVHLQFLGHPIANDPIYCNKRVWGANLGANDADASVETDEDIITRLSRMGKSEVASAVAYHDEMVDEYNKKKAEKLSGEVCEVCATPLYTDPGEQELSLWLHSLRYEDAQGAWSYVSPLPDWALPPEGEIGPREVGNMEELVAATCNDPEIYLSASSAVNKV
ncbi:pseudouridine synthase [Erysiphe pulchra]|uniref:Pseudouridine synthase n=1 Tax=Erysiphe pulchra TaxID=225359 RepID=A0A2S4PWC6_9PEZI|nr:pseudouridine synthase [Erysiphe pulchra]